MTSKLLLFEYSSFKNSEAVGAQNFEPLLLQGVLLSLVGMAKKVNA